MMRTAKKWILVAMLASLLQVTIYCDPQAWEDFFDNLDVQVYSNDGWDCGGHGYWYDCGGGDDWWVDVGWW